MTKKTVKPKKEVKKSKTAKREKIEKKPVKKERKKEKGVIFMTGKRKRAIARAAIKPGSGKILINGEPFENLKNEVLKLRLEEPFAITGKEWKSYDFIVKVKGGGILGQIDAARQAIARGLVEIFGPELKRKFLEYDRNLLVYDPRRTEPHKPPRSSQGPRRHKQRSKR
jgi:small subunit ribosomal protein S9